VSNGAGGNVVAPYFEVIDQEGKGNVKDAKGKDLGPDTAVHLEQDGDMISIMIQYFANHRVGLVIIVIIQVGM
jgi:hypothetical protein